MQNGEPTFEERYARLIRKVLELQLEDLGLIASGQERGPRWVTFPLPGEKNLGVSEVGRHQDGFYVSVGAVRKETGLQVVNYEFFGSAEEVRAYLSGAFLSEETRRAFYRLSKRVDEKHE